MNVGTLRRRVVGHVRCGSDGPVYIWGGLTIGTSVRTG